MNFLDQVPYSFQLKAQVEMPFPIIEIVSPSHSVALEKLQENSVVVQMLQVQNTFIRVTEIDTFQIRRMLSWIETLFFIY